MTRQLRMVDPTPAHLADIWANLAKDDAHALAAGLFPPAGPQDLAAWSATGCITSCVVLLDGQPIGYAGISSHPDHGHLFPWGITVERMEMTKRQTLLTCIKVWQVLRSRVAEFLGDEMAAYVSYLNMSPINHKRSRALLPMLGFTFTGDLWTSPAGTTFEFFKAPANV